jgi:hypothetical protein
VTLWCCDQRLHLLGAQVVFPVAPVDRSSLVHIVSSFIWGCSSGDRASVSVPVNLAPSPTTENFADLLDCLSFDVINICESSVCKTLNHRSEQVYSGVHRQARDADERWGLWAALLLHPKHPSQILSCVPSVLSMAAG